MFLPTQASLADLDCLPSCLLHHLHEGQRAGQVRDDKGRKMSKSLGNVVDPLDVIRDYSCDALRFTLATGKPVQLEGGSAPAYQRHDFVGLESQYADNPKS